MAFEYQTIWRTDNFRPFEYGLVRYSDPHYSSLLGFDFNILVTMYDVTLVFFFRLLEIPSTTFSPKKINNSFGLNMLRKEGQNQNSQMADKNWKKNDKKRTKKSDKLLTEETDHRLDKCWTLKKVRKIPKPPTTEKLDILEEGKSSRNLEARGIETCPKQS